MRLEPWLIYGLLSAVCAALVAIFGKIGMKGINPALATMVGSIVTTICLLTLCVASGLMSKLSSLQRTPLIMIILSGLSGAGAYFFYFRAIKLGSVTQAAPIDKISVVIAVLLAALILKERPTALNWIGIVLICIGAVFAAIPRAIE